MLVNQSYNSHTVSLFASTDQVNENKSVSSQPADSASATSTSASYYTVSSKGDKMDGVYADPAAATADTTQSTADYIRDAFAEIYEQDLAALREEAWVHNQFLAKLSDSTQANATLEVTEDTYAFWGTVATNFFESDAAQSFDGVNDLETLNSEQLAEMLAQQLESEDISLNVALDALGLTADELAVSLKDYMDPSSSVLKTQSNNLNSDSHQLDFWMFFATGQFNSGAGAILTTYEGDEGMTEEELLTRQFEKDADSQINTMKNFMAGLYGTNSDVGAAIMDKIPASGIMTDADWAELRTGLIDERRQSYENGETTYTVVKLAPTPMDDSMKDAAANIVEMQAMIAAQTEPAENETAADVS